VVRTGVQAPGHFEARCIDPLQQRLAGAKTQMLGQVGQNQPAFSVGRQVSGEPVKEASQHGAPLIVDAALER